MLPSFFFRSSVSRSHLDYEISSLVGRHIFFVNDIIGKYSFGRGRDAFKYRLYLQKLKVSEKGMVIHTGTHLIAEVKQRWAVLCDQMKSTPAPGAVPRFFFLVFFCFFYGTHPVCTCLTTA
jgi:hypothetical protein